MIGSVVVVGASVAGMQAAHTLRRDGFDGRITVIDGESATPYDKPPLSKQVLKGDWEPDRIVLPAAAEDLDIDWRLGQHAIGLDVDDRVVRLATERVSFDGLVLATGAAARHLPGTARMAGVFALRTLDDCLGLRAALDAGPSRVVVIGAGFIGSEVAATCRARGLEVTILEMAPVPLERALGAEMGMVCAGLHRDNGVDLRLGVVVDGLVGTDRVEGVQLADGEMIEAEVVVVGIGVAPTTGWIDGSGLTVDNGVVVDETLEAAPGIVAAGDLARYPSRRFGGLQRIEHWENAVQMGAAAAKRLLVADGETPEAYDPVPYFWSDQYDRKIQLVGRSGADDRIEVVHGSTDERRFVALYGRQGRVVGVLGMNRPRHVMGLKALVDDAVSWDDGLERARAF
jgi:3-phenylpropionate/trans-cinnamate dioxygenase ferredoxin reductase subunit